MTWIFGHYQNVRSGFGQGAVVMMMPPVEMSATVDTSAEYDPETVKKILTAKDGELAKAPKDPDAFLAWLLA